VVPGLGEGALVPLGCLPGSSSVAPVGSALLVRAIVPPKVGSDRLAKLPIPQSGAAVEASPCPYSPRNPNLSG
jgi:hypothetical protein